MLRKLTKLLPNIITLSRSLLALLLILFASQQLWEISLLVLVLAIMSDFMDGLAAKYFNAESTFGAIADPIADTMLAAACIIGLYLNGFVSIWSLSIMAGSAVAIGCVKFLSGLSFNSSGLRSGVQSFSVAYLFIVWIGSTWAYASLAYGWSWLYPLVTLLLLMLAARLKRHRLAEWYGWLVSDRRQR